MGQIKVSNARKRIDSLLDDRSFIEIGSYVKARSTDFNISAIDTESDGVITGYGSIDGSLVYVYSQDANILGGSIGEMHARKISSLYEKAMKMGAPIIGLVDCAGLRLQEATDALDAFGKLYLNQVMASGYIPQIKAVFGYAGGGMAISLGLDDFVFLSNEAKVFVNSPNAIKGNYEGKCDTSCSRFHSNETGIADFSGEETEVFEKIRELISLIPANNEDDMSYEECKDSLNRLVPEVEGYLEDTALFLRSISDENYFYEVKAEYAKEMCIGFIKLNGNTIGTVASRTAILDEEGRVTEELKAELTRKGVEKAKSFINFCDAFNIPILSLVNVEGYSAKKCTEKYMIKSLASLTYAFANATVPKVNIILKKAYGSAYVLMNSKSIGADLVYAYRNSSIGMMNSKVATEIIYNKELEEVEDKLAFVEEKSKEYENLQTSALSAASRGYVDDIIEYEQTRKVLIAAFEMLFTKREDRPVKKHGTI